MNKPFQLGTTAVAVVVLLAACGGGDSSPGRGTLKSEPQVVTTLTAAQIDAATTATGISALAGTAQCDVQVVALDYDTVGVRNDATNASAVMLVPAGACSGRSFPLVAYAKGTDVRKPRTLANPADSETFLLASMYAAQGYAVVATDYLGYARSSYSFHPYLHADSEASSVIDSIRAARKAATARNLTLSGKVMVTGYSQGGHSSAATQRAIERDNAQEINLVAAAHQSAPLNLSASFKVPDAIAGYQFFVPFLITAWQKVYGNLYANPSDVFKAPYAATIESLLPSPTLDYTTLVTTGAVPGALGETPNEARDKMFQSAYITAVRTDDNHPLAQAAKRNDLVDWSPKARTLLCYGAQDPTVPPVVHSVPAQAAFAGKGLSNVSSVDVDPFIQATFGTNGQAPAPGAPNFAAYYGSYHGSYVPPFCHAQTRAVFDALK